MHFIIFVVIALISYIDHSNEPRAIGIAFEFLLLCVVAMVVHNFLERINNE